jgi:hypothetical protein
MGWLDWTDFAQDIDRWRALVETVMNYSNFSNSIKLWKFIERIYTWQLVKKG